MKLFPAINKSGKICEASVNLKNKYHNILINPERYHQNKQSIKSHSFLKSSENKIEKLDSMIYLEFDENTNEWQKSGKEEFYFDSNGNNITNIEFEWNDDLNNWVEDSREEFSYENNPIAHTELYINYPASNRKEEFFKNNSNKDTLIIWYNWDEENNKWKENERERLSYDIIGNCISEVYYWWNEDYNDWSISKNEYIFSEYNNLQTETSYYFDGYSWIGNHKTIFEYQNNLDLLFSTWYSFSDGEWIAEGKAEYYKGVNSKDSITYYYDKNINTGQLEFNSKWTYDYNENNSLISETGYDWLDAEQKWVNSWQEDYAYDEYGNMLTITYYRREEIIDHEEITYDTQVSFEDVILPNNWFGSSYDNTEHYKSKIISMTYSEIEGDVYKAYAKSIPYYSELPATGIAKIKPQNNQFYPNPASEYIILNSDTPVEIIKIFDFGGKKLLEEYFPSQSKINISYLESGFYLVRIKSSSDEIYTGKLIKK